MSDHDPKTNVYVTSGPATSNGGGGMGAPGLHSNIASAPPERNVNVTVEQPRAAPTAPSAPAAPANPAPAAPRQ